MDAYDLNVKNQRKLRGPQPDEGASSVVGDLFFLLCLIGLDLGMEPVLFPATNQRRRAQADWQR